MSAAAVPEPPPGNAGLSSSSESAYLYGSSASSVPELSSLSIDPSEPPRPPPSIVKTEGVITFDITEKFKAATKTLKPGQLVKDGFFTLFESVGALEIMDPKMDSGCLAEGESLDPDFDVRRRLLPAEVIGIIDQLLCHEIAWHLGYPLSQTILTNIYIEKMLSPEPLNIEDADFIRSSPDQKPRQRDPAHAVLRAYCLGLVKTCYFVNEQIKGEHYYEEEDFVTNTYQRTLLDHIDRIDVRSAIQEARATLYGLKLPPKLYQALDFRLQLRVAFLRATELSAVRSVPESIKLPFIEMQTVLKHIHSSHQIGTPVPDAFSSKLQSRLASTMPPRPIVNLSFEDAIGHFKRLCADGAEVSDVLKYNNSQTFLNFVFFFQAKKPQPLVYIRTLLQSYIYKDDIILGRMSVRQILDDDLSVVVLPLSPLLDPANDKVEAPHDPRFALARQMEIFRERAAQSYLEIFRAMSQNRCRIRRNFCHAIHDWEVVQVDAEEIDVLLQVQLGEQPMESLRSEPVYSLPLSSWAYLYKLRIMEWIVQLGFELEVYQPAELAGMYRYLSYLATTRRQHLERIKTFSLEGMNSMHHSQPAPFLPAERAKDQQWTRSLSFLRTSKMDATVTMELASALSSLYALIYRLKLLPTPQRPFGSDELRMEVRMKPFASIGLPEMLPVDSFDIEAGQSRVPTLDLLAAAEQAVASARKGYEAMAKLSEKEAFCFDTAYERWVARAKNCLKASISAGIAVAVIRKAYEIATGPDAAADVEVDGLKALIEVGITASVPRPDEGYHEWWIVPKISVKGPP